HRHAIDPAGLSRFSLTRANAALTLPRATTCSISWSLPERPSPFVSVDASPLRLPDSQWSRSSFRSALRQLGYQGICRLRLATTASADFSLRLPTSPFQAQGEISPGKTP